MTSGSLDDDRDSRRPFRVPDTAWAVVRRVHGHNATATVIDAAGEHVKTDDLLDVERRPEALATPVKGVRAVMIARGDAYGFDTVAHIAARHGLRVVGRWTPDGTEWVGYLLNPAWALVNRACRDIEQQEHERVLRGWRSPTETVIVARGVPVAALVPDERGGFTELVFDSQGQGSVVEVSATYAERVTGRPDVCDGPNAWKPRAGARRAARDVRDVLLALVDTEPEDRLRPWMLVRGESGRALAVLVSRGFKSNDISKFLLERGIPSLHPWRACYLPVDGDSELAVRAAMDVAESAGHPLLGAYSGSRSVTGFRNLCLVMLVPPADRDAVADAIHDRMAVLADEWGLRRPDRHVARPHELSRLPCMASVKVDSEVGYAFIRPLEQPQVGPTRVEPVPAAEAARVLRTADAVTIPAASVAGDRVHLAPTRRPLGADAAMWVAGMGAPVRWHLNADLKVLGQRYKNADGTDSASEAAWRCLSSMRARGATPEDIRQVLAAGGSGVRAYLEAFGRSDEAQVRGLTRDVVRYDAMRTTQGVGRNHAVAESLWQAIPADAPCHLVKVLAVVLDLVARVGRVDEQTGEIRVDLGKRRLVEEAGAAWKTLLAAAELLPWLELPTGTAKGGRGEDRTGDRAQSTWVLNPALAVAPETTVRVPLRSYVDTLLRSRLVHATGIGPTQVDLLLALTRGAVTRAEARERFDLTPQRLSQVVAGMAKAGLVTADRETLSAGSTSFAAAALALGGVERYEEVVDRHLAERADDDDRIERNKLPKAERSRAYAVKAQADHDMACAVAGMEREDTEHLAPADDGLEEAELARLERDGDVPTQVEPTPAQVRAVPTVVRPIAVRPFSDPDAAYDDGDGLVDELRVQEPGAQEWDPADDLAVAA